MLTGTPLDLTPFGALLKGIGVIYWLLAALGLWLALRGTARWRTKLLRLIPVVLLFGFVPGRQGWAEYQARQRLDASMQLFQEHCKSAGEKVTRTIENVDGIVWMKWRPSGLNDGDQFKLDDPYGKDCSGESCIADLLRVTKGSELNPEDANRHTKGYRFVETTDPSGQFYRYVGVEKLRSIWTDEAIARQKARTGKGVEPGDHEFTLERQPMGKLTARYGITWDDISTREDRDHWIAGGSLKVIDLSTNEVIAERVGYMMDRGLGNTAGFRSPWGDAPRTACPSFAKAPGGGPFMSYRTRDFVLKILQSKQGE
jgi:hypothetical protein